MLLLVSQSMAPAANGVPIRTATAQSAFSVNGSGAPTYLSRHAESEGPPHSHTLATPSGISLFGNVVAAG